MEETLQCLECGKGGEMMMCEKCGTVFCSIECMANNWKKPNSHRTICGKLSKMKEEYTSVVKEMLDTLLHHTKESVGADEEEEGNRPPQKRIKFNALVENEETRRLQLQHEMATANIVPNVNNAAVQTTLRSILNRPDQQTMLEAFRVMLQFPQYAGLITPVFTALTRGERFVLFKEMMIMASLLETTVSTIFGNNTMNTEEFVDLYGSVLIAMPNQILHGTPGRVIPTNTGIRLNHPFVIGVGLGAGIAGKTMKYEPWKKVVGVMSRLDLSGATAVLKDAIKNFREPSDGRFNATNNLNTYRWCVETLFRNGGCRRFAFRHLKTIWERQINLPELKVIQGAVVEHVSSEADLAAPTLLSMFSGIGVLELVPSGRSDPETFDVASLLDWVERLHVHIIDVMFGETTNPSFGLTVQFLRSVVKSPEFWFGKLRNVAVCAFFKKQHYHRDDDATTTTTTTTTTSPTPTREEENEDVDHLVHLVEEKGRNIRKIRIQSLSVVISETVTLHVDENTQMRTLPVIGQIAMLLFDIVQKRSR